MTHNCDEYCTAGWSPGNKCHCRSCGENFTTVRNFDTHRVTAVRLEKVCVDPSDAGLVLNSRGYWMKAGEIDRAEVSTRSVLSSRGGDGQSGG